MKARLIIAWIGNLIDTIATLYLSAHIDGVELNPISAMLLKSPILFVLVKMIVMSVAVVCIWILRDRKIFKISSWILSILYAAVAVYYIIIFYVYNLICGLPYPI